MNQGCKFQIVAWYRKDNEILLQIDLFKQYTLQWTRRYPGAADLDEEWETAHCENKFFKKGQYFCTILF